MQKGIDFHHHTIRNWFIKQATGFPKITIFISLILTAMMGFGLRWFIVEDDVLKILPEDMESRVVWDDVRDEFGNTEIIFVAFGHKGESIFNPKTLSSLWEVTRTLEELPGVDEVMSISSQNRMDNIDDMLEISDLQPKKILSDKEIQGIKSYLEKSPKIKKRFVSRNGDYTSIAVRLSIASKIDVVTKEIVNTVRGNLEGFEINFGGQAYMTGVTGELIREDVQSLMKGGMLIMVLVLLINLRSPLAVGMVLSVIGLSLVAMMGFMGWMVRFTGSDKFLFTMVNTSMPIILLTIANSDGVHVMTKFFRTLRKEKNIHTSVERTMDSLLIPIFLTSVTTIAAFLSMGFAPIEPLKGYGFSIGIGIGWAWFLSSLFLPALISLTKWKMDSKAVTHGSLFENLIDKFGKQVILHPKVVLGFGIVLVLVGSVGVTKLRVNVNILDFFKRGTEIRESMEFQDREMTGNMDIQFRVKGDMKSPETLNSIKAIQNHVEAYPFVTLSMSIADVIEQMHRTVMDDDPAFETIPETRGKVNNLFTMYAMSGDPEDFESLVDYDYETGLISALSTNITTEEIIETVGDLKDFVSQEIGNELGVEQTGMVIVFRDIVDMVIESSFISIFLSLFLIGGIASYFFKRILWGVLAIVPLFSAVILNFGFMGIFRVDLSHVTAILSSIIIGVGVDFAIHYISQYRRMVKRGVSGEILSREVVDEVGYPIILDAGSNMGFGALLFSAFVPIQYIGGLMVFAMLSTSIGTLTLLAAAAELLKKRLGAK